MVIDVGVHAFVGLYVELDVDVYVTSFVDVDVF